MLDGLVRPTYGLDSLAAVLPGACGALGVDLTTGTGLNSLDCAAALDLPPSPAAVVVLCDGLGYHNLAASLAYAPFLRAALSPGGGAVQRRLTTSFPSTTAAALGTFGTGTAPGRTGLVGYTQRDPDTGDLVNLVQWKVAGRPWSRPPRQVQREPTVFAQAVAHDVAVASVGPAKFAGSAMSAAALHGGAYLAADPPAAGVDAMAGWLAANAGAPALGYFYWGVLDKIGHHRGWRSAKWGDALADFDRELQRLVAAVPPGTLVLLTADHGQIEVDPKAAIDVAQTPLASDVAAIGGEPRAVHVYLEPGADVEQVAARWATYLGDRAIVLRRDEAVADGLFGPVAAHVVPWLGDLVVLALGATTIVDSRTQSEAARTLLGVHGSLTEFEMEIPLIAFKGE